jgi:hypothetical protein
MIDFFHFIKDLRRMKFPRSKRRGSKKGNLLTTREKDVGQGMLHRITKATSKIPGFNIFLAGSIHDGTS